MECHFLCAIHGPQNCMKGMNSAFRCWNLCFRMLLWCFNPIDTIHLFLWEKISPFGCGVMARLWLVQTTGFGVCLWQSLNNSPGKFSNAQRQGMMIENPNLDGQVHTLFSENRTMSKLHWDENACFPVYWNCLMKLFACKLNCLKQSLIWCHFHSTQMTTEESLYPTHCLLKACFWGYAHLRHSYDRIRHGNQ